MADEEMSMEEEIVEGSGESTSLENQTVFVPKQGENYSIPDSGRAMVTFEKIAEDESGCTVRLADFEPEGEEELEVTEDMDTKDHIDSFINSERGKSYS